MRLPGGGVNGSQATVEVGRAESRVAALSMRGGGEVGELAGPCSSYAVLAAPPRHAGAWRSSVLLPGQEQLRNAVRPVCGV
ncbi:hypothetical protein chiPu_0029677, partial [Chiloscyllium punctatum]|nr:hypothetical protein [Chiloscyllium punctatum]